MQDYDITGNTPPPCMVLFAGQGSARVGMGANVLDQSAATREVWQCASDIAGIDVRKLCLKGPMTRLTQTRFQQIAVTTVNVATLTALRTQTALIPGGSAGHSAGEYAALWLAGVFTLETLFQAVVTRAAIMQRLAEKNRGAMFHLQGLTHAELAVRLTDSEHHHHLSIACDNAQDQLVFAGEIQAAKSFVQTLLAAGYSPTKLAVNGAWHCAQMAEGVAEMQQLLKTLPLCSPTLPVYMNRTARPETNVEKITENLAFHLTEPVRWRESMFNSLQDGFRHYVEISPKKYLLSLIDENSTMVTRRHCHELLSVADNQ